MITLHFHILNYLHRTLNLLATPQHPHNLNLDPLKQADVRQYQRTINESISQIKHLSFR